MTRILREITVLFLSLNMSHNWLYLPAAERHRPLASTYCAYPRRDGQAELTWVLACEINFPQQELNSNTVTHPGTNRARCRTTSSMWPMALLLSQPSDVQACSLHTFHPSQNTFKPSLKERLFSIARYHWGVLAWFWRCLLTPGSQRRQNKTVMFCLVCVGGAVMGKSQIKSNHDVNQMTTVPDSIVYVRNVINVRLACRYLCKD